MEHYQATIQFNGQKIEALIPKGMGIDIQIGPRDRNDRPAVFIDNWNGATAVLVFDGTSEDPIERTLIDLPED